MAKAFINDENLTDIADAIRAKLGVSTQYLPSEMAGAINSIPSGGGSVSDKDVNFYDYDGTLVASYTTAEALVLESLPVSPTHTNLTFEGWNYTLAQMQTYVNAYGKLNIGAMYHTTDGKMHLIFEADADHLEASLNIGSTVSGAVSVDWGDGSQEEAWSGTSVQRKTHTYSSVGVYDVKVTCSSGNIVMSNYLCGSKTVQGADGTTKIVIDNYDSRYTQIYLPSSVTSIGNNCFRYCLSLQSITIPSSVTSLGSSCFSYCTSLRSVTIPSSVSSLGSSCFSYCTSLQSVTIPSSVSSLGGSCFQSCSSLRSMTIPSSVTSLGSSCFQYCSSLRSVTIPSSVTSLGSSCFQYCSSLRSVTIPSSVTSLGSSCFSYCTSLRSVTIPSSVSSLGSSCFSYCTSLQSVTIPSSVTSLGNSCFATCDILTEYHFESTVPPTITATSVLTVGNGVTIYVPTGSLSDYQTANIWSTWATKMAEDAPEPFYIMPLYNNGCVTVTRNSGASDINLQYSLNKTTWENLTIAEGETHSFIPAANQKVYFKAQPSATTKPLDGWKFSATTQYNVGGRLLSLIYASTWMSDNTMSTIGNQKFFQLFQNETNLIDANQLKMADNCTYTCYQSMFYNCSNLTAAPDLPATDLGSGEGCYQSMFRGCTNLTAAPDLPATTLKNYCYNGMFNGCTSLTSIKCLATNINATNCTANMTNGVAANGTFTKDANMNDWTTGVNGIPSGWSVVNA